MKMWNNLPYNKELKIKARALRKSGNLSEVLLWQQLKSKKLLSFDFDRQKIIGNYIVDFYCSALGVVIEVDGHSHDFKIQYDQKREEYLKQHGLLVLHILDIDVKQNLVGVLTYLEQILYDRIINLNLNYPVRYASSPSQVNGNLECRVDQKLNINLGLLNYKKVTHNDKPLVEKWLSEAHVVEFFYGEGLQNTLNNLALYCQGINDNGCYSFDQWIGFYDGIPFAFLITSTVTGPYDPKDPYDKWYVDGEETCTLDVLIGAKEFLGKGLSTVMIKQFILKRFPKTDYFIIDPELENEKAIHVYEKVGFQKTEVFTPEYNKVPHQMMHLEVKDLING